jgi:hypothetical protein
MNIELKRKRKSECTTHIPPVKEITFSLDAPLVPIQRGDLIRIEDLPMKGLGFSFDSVELNSCVLVPYSIGLEDVVWSFTQDNMKQRAYELNADVNYMEVPDVPPFGQRYVLMWFSRRG